MKTEKSTKSSLVKKLESILDHLNSLNFIDIAFGVGENHKWPSNLPSEIHY